MIRVERKKGYSFDLDEYGRIKGKKPIFIPMKKAGPVYSENISDDIDREAQRYADEKGIDYRDAVLMVLSENQEMAKRYVEGSG